MSIKAVGAIVGILTIGAIFYGPIVHYSTQDTVNAVVVTEKERIGGADDGRYMVWTKDETFQNTDTIWAWKFNSADVYGKLPVGATCNFKVVGFRAGFLSMNRNILSADCV